MNTAIAQFDRFELRLLTAQDADTLKTLEPGDLSNSQGEWFCIPGGEKAFLEAALREEDAGKGFWAGIWDGKTLAGMIALHDLDQSSKSAGISYVLSAPFRGQGIMAKACRLLVSHAFEKVGLERVHIIADIANQPSWALPEKLGFKKEGILRDCYRAASGSRDAVQYSICANEWNQ